MDKRFLSRAKHPNDNGWIYGFYAECMGKDENDEITPIIISIDPQKPKCRYKEYIVPETMCQCTGELDKNDSIIYENDVLKMEAKHKFGDTYHGFVTWECGTWRVEHYGGTKRHLCDCLYLYNCEVVGNTIDNPELWEE